MKMNYCSEYGDNVVDISYILEIFICKRNK